MRCSGKKLLILAHMIATNRDALICDLAESYNVYDFKQLPCKTVAVLACGLGDDSRIKRKLSKMPVSYKELILTRIADDLAFLCWAQTKDAQAGINRPERLMTRLFHPEGLPKESMTFESGEDFRKEWNRRLKAIKEGGG